MSVPFLKFGEDRKPIVDGDFEFTKSPLMYSGGVNFHFEFTFKFSPECPADLFAAMSKEDINEVVAEKLKRDFLKILNK